MVDEREREREREMEKEKEREKEKEKEKEGQAASRRAVVRAVVVLVLSDMWPMTQDGWKGGGAARDVCGLHHNSGLITNS